MGDWAIKTTARSWLCRVSSRKRWRTWARSVSLSAVNATTHLVCTNKLTHGRARFGLISKSLEETHTSCARVRQLWKTLMPPLKLQKAIRSHRKRLRRRRKSKACHHYQSADLKCSGCRKRQKWLLIASRPVQIPKVHTPSPRRTWRLFTSVRYSQT